MSDTAPAPATVAAPAPVVVAAPATAARGVASIAVAGAMGTVILAVAKHYGWEVDTQTATALVVLLGAAIHVAQHMLIREDPSSEPLFSSRKK